jgi:hypothetical protein
MRPLAVAVCIVVASMKCAVASAQVVSGRVLHDATGATIAEVAVTLQTPDGQRVARTVTDTAGAFSVKAPRFGSFVLTAVLDGLSSVSTAPFNVGPGTLEVVIRMAEAVVPLDPLVVEGRNRPADLGVLAGYYERMQWNERTGLGRFITRDAIDLRNPLEMSDMLRELPRVNVNRARGTGAFVTMRGSRGDCTPALFIDGMRINRRDRAYVDELVRPGDVEGVEVYVGLAQLPGSYHDESGCGVLLVWTRRGSEDGRPFSWRRAAVALGLIGGFLLLVR